MQENLEKKLVGLSTEHRHMDYTWRDVALYALAVGAKEHDLQYTYERNMKALPPFGVVPYWAALSVSPRIPRPMPAPTFAERLIRPTVAPLHMEHTLEIDQAGNRLCTNIANTLFQEGGGFGGKPMPKNPVAIPQRAPDFALDDYISPVQNVLYRLTGDTNLVHVDPEVARERGFDRVFMQGLCSFGFAARLAIEALMPGRPEQLTKISAQMRSILYPGTKIQMRIWTIQDGQAYFRLVNQETGAAVLDRGVLEWK